MERSSRDGERKWRSDQFRGFNSSSAFSKGAEDTAILHGNAASGGMYIHLRADIVFPPGYILDGSRQLSQCKGKWFLTIELQHKTERENEKVQNSVLTVDSILRAKRVVTSRQEQIVGPSQSTPIAQYNVH